jgi:hypothetical protein
MNRSSILTLSTAALLCLGGLAIGQPARADDSDLSLRVDHYVGVKSTVPAIAGEMTEIYVREVVRAHTVLRSWATPVVLFIHGAGTPAEVAFDPPYRDYSWMAYLARAGFDVFSTENTGYGRSTRPTVMNDPCNLSAEQQIGLSLDGHAEPCTASYRQNMTTIASDWNEIGAVVDHLLALRHQSQLRTPVTTNESDCAWAPCGDVTQGGEIPRIRLRQYAGRHDRHASDSAKMGVRRLEAR